MGLNLLKSATAPVKTRLILAPPRAGLFICYTGFVNTSSDTPASLSSSGLFYGRKKTRRSGSKIGAAEGMQQERAMIPVIAV